MRNEDGSFPTLNFRDAIAEILWNWQPGSSMEHHQIHRDKDGIHVDKLYIGPTEAQYKTQNWVVGAGVYDKLNQVLDLILPMLEPLESEKESPPSGQSPP